MTTSKTSWCATVLACLIPIAACTAHAQQVAGAERSGAETRAADDLLNRRVTVDVTRVPLRRAITAAMASARVLIQYRAETVDAYHKTVTVRLRDVPLRTVLERILAETSLRAVADGATKLMIVDQRGDTTEQAIGGRGMITGRVTDSATGKGIGQVTVTIVGARTRVVTDASGRFTVRDVAAGEQTVVAKALGFRTVSQHVTVVGGESVDLRLTLVAVPTVLGGVVTTAVGTQRRLEVASDITTLNADSILQHAPVSSVTELLDGRVPGLVVQRQSGAPGAPARLRMRGISSMAASNDPIIVVDGVRVYSEQTSDRGVNNEQHSVLDKIDVNTIEKVDVLKGPSASALYGADAANGVIVITTKHGRAGNTQWTFSTDQQRMTQPRTFPTFYNRRGIGVGFLNGFPLNCQLGDVSAGTAGGALCVGDSLYVFSPLTNPATTVLGTGTDQTYTASVSGGSSTLRYYLQGSRRRTLGLLTMSAVDAVYLARTSGAPVPGWQRRPQRNAEDGVTSTMSLQVTPALAVNLTTAVTRSLRQTTPLDRVLSVLQNPTSVADTSAVIPDASGNSRLPAVRQQQTYAEQGVRLAASGEWLPRPWWNAHADAGLDVSDRDDQDLLRHGDCVIDLCGGFTGNAGTFRGARGHRSAAAVNLRGALQLPRRLGVRLTPTVGLNYLAQSAADLTVEKFGLPLGATTPHWAGGKVSESNRAPQELGAFVNVDVALFDRWHTNVGTRTDASNALGSKIRPTFPKLDWSYLVSDEGWFPWKRAVNALRLRVAYGHSAVQPDVGQALRTYRTDATNGATEWVTVGNTHLKPERSTEWEGGIDLGVLNDRVQLTVSRARKLSRDALATMPLPPSVVGHWGEGVATNLGSVRNRTTELTLSATVLDRTALRWTVGGQLTRLRNQIVSLAPTADRSFRPLSILSGYPIGVRYAEGYPVEGTWMLPVVGYADANGDGAITAGELVRSDSAVFVGGSLPNYDATLNTSVGLWHDRLTLAATVQYQDGVSRINSALVTGALDGTALLRALNDSATSLAEQAAVRSGYAFLRPVSVLRFSALSIRFAAPRGLARRLRASDASVALQGSNLGLRTTYSGADPNVSGSIRSDGGGSVYSDPGVLPQPRTWGLNVRLTY